MTIDPKQNAINEIRRNIAKHGFHTYFVTGGGAPHYAYTIGLSESLGAELILAGAYYYDVDEVSIIIKNVAGKLRSAHTGQIQQMEAGVPGTFTLGKVDESWEKRLMAGVFDYYRVSAFDAYQILPDAEHWTIEIPNLSRPWTSESVPAWRRANEPWPYPVPRTSVALTDVGALQGKRITEVMRWEPDEWEMFAGAGPDIAEAERRVVPLGVLLAADLSLLPAVDLSVGTGLWRDAQSEWHPWASSREENNQEPT
jgi:Domain of unknown function (DUF4262)